MKKFLPWKKQNENEEPDIDAILEGGPALGELTFDDDADRSSEEEDLLNQYLNSDNDSDDSETPSAGSFPASSAGSPMASESQEAPASVPSGGSDDDTEDEAGSVGFQFPVDDDDNDDEDDEKSGDLADVMSIFEEDEEVDEDLTSLTQGLQDIDAAELLAEARSVARRLADMVSN